MHQSETSADIAKCPWESSITPIWESVVYKGRSGIIDKWCWPGTCCVMPRLCLYLKWLLVQSVRKIAIFAKFTQWSVLSMDMRRKTTGRMESWRPSAIKNAPWTVWWFFKQAGRFRINLRLKSKGLSSEHKGLSTFLEKCKWFWWQTWR